MTVPANEVVMVVNAQTTCAGVLKHVEQGFCRFKYREIPDGTTVLACVKDNRIHYAWCMSGANWYFYLIEPLDTFKQDVESGQYDGFVDYVMDATLAMRMFPTEDTEGNGRTHSYLFPKV